MTRTAAVARRGPGRPPGPNQSPDVRARLVTEASRLYAAGGYAGLSYGVLAQRAHLTKATLFHYFPTKDALVLAIFAALGERLATRVQAWFDPPPESFTARLDRLIAGLIDFYGNDPVNAQIVCHGLMEVGGRGPSPLGGADAPLAFGEFVRRFTRFLEDGVAAGAFYPDRPLGTLMAIGGVVLFEFMNPPETRRRFGGGRVVPAAARTPEMLQFIRRAVVRPGVRRVAAGRRRGVR